MFEMVRNIVVDDTSELEVEYISLLVDIRFDSMTRVKVVIVVVLVVAVAAAAAAVVDNTWWVFVRDYNDDDVDGYLHSIRDKQIGSY